MHLFIPRFWPIRWWLTALNVAVLVATLLGLGGLFLSQVDTALVAITAEHLRDQARPIVQFRLRPGAPPLPAGPPQDVSQRPAPLQPGPLPDAAQRPGPFQAAPGEDGGERPPPFPREPGRPPGGPGPAGPGPANPATLAAFIVGTLRGPDTGVAVFDAAGQPLAASETAEGAEAWPNLDPDQLRAALAGAEQMTVVRQETRRTLAILLPWIGPESTTVGAVRVMHSLELTDQVRARLGGALVIGTLLAALVAGLVGFRATRAALRPLDRVIVAARQIAAGQTEQRLRLTRRDEVGELAEAFDTMLDRLAAALAAQRRFVADAAHELRTPLTALGGVVEMLQLGADRGDAATTRRLLDSMEREIARLTRLVGALLALSRLDAEQGLSLAPVRLAALLADVAEETRLLAQGQNVTCAIEATPTVLADTDRLKQALLNLSANALAFTPPGGRIAFGVSTVNGTARLVVADTGSGIDPALLPRVMERFVRGDPSRSRETGGSGLGLAIVQSIVEAHGGRVVLESEVGQGTRATIELPLGARALG